MGKRIATPACGLVRNDMVVVTFSNILKLLFYTPQVQAAGAGAGVEGLGI